MVDVVLAGTKADHRAALLAARRAVAPGIREAEAVALCEHLAAIAGPGDTVCAYVPVGAEPGSVDLVERLRDLGARVLLPVTCPGDPEALRWGEYRPGALVARRFGLLEPAGPSLAATAIAEAAVVLVPALAVDRHGVRLGRGGGYYDRSLPLCSPGALLVAVIRDEELVAELPSEPHDVRMTHALTPQRGLVTLDRP